MFKQVFSKNQNKDSGITSFQALATAVAAQVGTGNLAGAATAIAAGGPGAIFGCGLVPSLVWGLYFQKRF